MAAGEANGVTTGTVNGVTKGDSPTAAGRIVDVIKITCGWIGVATLFVWAG